MLHHHRPFGPIPVPPSPIFGTVPVGTIIMWAGNIPSDPAPSIPPFFNPEDYGWLVCDGRSLECGQHYNLYTVLGTVYGGPTDNTTFNIPNYQGYFPRAIDPGKTIDKDRRTPQEGDKTGIAGTTQLSAVQTHTHPYTMPAGPSMAVQVGAQAPVPTNIVESTTANTPTGPPDVPDSTSPQAVLVSQNETRAVNIAVYFLIKAI